MDMIERYAVEAGVEGLVFSKRKFHSTIRFTYRVRIIGYIWVTLNPVKSETPSLDMILSKSSSPGFGLRYSFFLSNFELRGSLI